MAWRFLVWFFVSFWVNQCVFPLSGLLRALLILLSCCLSIRLFLIFFGCQFLSKIVRFLLHPVVGIFSCHLLPIVGGIFFRCFGMSSFVCIVLPFVDTSLIFLLSPVLSGLFPQVVVSFFFFCLFLFVSPSSSIFVSSFWSVFVDILCVSNRISHPGFDFFFVFFFWGGLQFSHKLFSPLHRLVRLIRLYYSLIYKVVLVFFCFLGFFFLFRLNRSLFCAS